jgi:hypothetical protein
MTISSVSSNSNGVSLLDLDQQLSLSPTADSGAEIAALLVLGARDSRDQAKAAAQAEDQRLTQLEDKQVHSLLEQADATRTAGWQRGLGQIIAGGATLASVAITAGASGSAGKTQAQINASQASAQNWAQGVASGGGVIQGGLGLMATESDHDAGVSAADATGASNAAKHVERHLQQLQQEQSDASQLVRSAIQTASDLSRAQTSADQATIFLRG